jgi:hypothetical protein
MRRLGFAGHWISDRGQGLRGRGERGHKKALRRPLIDRRSPNFGRSAERPSLTGVIILRPASENSYPAPRDRGGMTHFSIPLLRWGKAFYPARWIPFLDRSVMID